MINVTTIKDQAARVADRLAIIRLDPPSFSLRTVLIVGVVLAVGGWLWGWSIKRERDAWWRARIAASSAVVAAIVRKGTTIAEATDADIIQGLQDADHQLTTAEQALHRLTARPPAGDRAECRVPARCLRLD